jgi:hypothetical protein
MSESYQPLPKEDADMLTRLQSVPHLHMGQGFLDALREQEEIADAAGNKTLATLLGFAHEVGTEAKVAHLLLDMIDGNACAMNGHLDERMMRFYRKGAVDRLARIAEAHCKNVDESGGTWGDCNECGWSWPCPTYAWATTERDHILDPWNPSDDEQCAVPPPAQNERPS